MLRAIIRSHAQAHRPLSRLAYDLARYYVGCYRNLDYEPARNGEFRLVERLRGLDLGVFFDVGANHGEWSAFVRRTHPGCALHAFEIAPATFARLRANLPAEPHLNAFGLADHDGTVDLHFFPEADTMSTTLDMGFAIHRDRQRVERADVRRGDGYCRERGIERIDLLKIDTEGAEPQVLAGFGAMLDQGGIRAVQFEYGMANIYTKHLLIDYYRNLGPSFLIGPVTPRGVDFRDYDPRDEDFRTPNFLAVLRTETALIERVRVQG